MTPNFYIYLDSYEGKNYINNDYAAYFQDMGYIEFISPLSNLDRAVNDPNAILVVPGGADVDPSKYGEIPHPNLSRINPQFEYLDSHLLPRFLQEKKRVIGICRGCQAVNVALGGSLHQHILGHNDIKGTHDVKIYREALKLKKDLYLEVVSSHHQSVRLVGKGLSIVGTATIGDANCPSLIEPRMDTWAKSSAFEVFIIPEMLVGENIFLVQYHPEKNRCATTKKLIKKHLGL